MTSEFDSEPIPFLSPAEARALESCEHCFEFGVRCARHNLLLCQVRSRASLAALEAAVAALEQDVRVLRKRFGDVE